MSQTHLHSLLQPPSLVTYSICLRSFARHSPTLIPSLLPVSQSAITPPALESPPSPPHCISSSENYLHRTSHHQAGKRDLPGPSTNAHISAVLPAHGALQTPPDAYGLTRIYPSVKHCCSQSTSISTWLWQ